MKMQEGMKADVMKKNFVAEDGSVSKGDINVDSFPQNIKSIIATLRIVIDQIGSGFEQARELILEIARQLDEGRLCERNQISRTPPEDHIWLRHRSEPVCTCLQVPNILYKLFVLDQLVNLMQLLLQQGIRVPKQFESLGSLRF
jgi:hypothetical protein